VTRGGDIGVNDARPGSVAGALRRRKARKCCSIADWECVLNSREEVAVHLLVNVLDAAKDDVVRLSDAVDNEPNAQLTALNFPVHTAGRELLSRLLLHASIAGDVKGTRRWHEG